MKAVLDNPVSGTFIALLVALLAVMGAFGLYVTSPDSYGEPCFSVEPESIYYFGDYWLMAYDFLEISFAPGTLVVPGYHNGRVTAVLMIAPDDSPGTFTFRLPAEHRGELPASLEDTMSQALLIINYDDFKNIIRDSGDTILLRAEDIEIPYRYLVREFDRSYNILSHYQFFGFTNHLHPLTQTVLMQLEGNRTGLLTYYEDTTVKLSGQGIEVEFPHPELDKQFYPPGGFVARVSGYIALLTLAASALAVVITGGQNPDLRSVKGEYNPLWTVAALAAAFIYSWLLVLYNQHFHPAVHWMALLWALPLTLVAAWATQARLSPGFFGLKLQGTMVAIILAVVLSVFMVLGSAFRLPTGIELRPGLFLAVLAAALFREALLRGFCQRIIAHWLHPWLGVAIVSIAWTLMVVMSQLPLAVGSSLTLLAMSTLGKSLVLGVAYHRTGNILAPGLLAGLLEYAATYFVF